MYEATPTPTSMTRQVTPNTLFGGVDALIESSDWWLRDQASLAMGFDNWMGVPNGSSDMNNNGTSQNIVGGVGNGFYMSGGNGKRGAEFDDEWYG